MLNAMMMRSLGITTPDNLGVIEINGKEYPKQDRGYSRNPFGLWFHYNEPIVNEETVRQGMKDYSNGDMSQFKGYNLSDIRYCVPDIAGDMIDLYSGNLDEDTWINLMEYFDVLRCILKMDITFYGINEGKARHYNKNVKEGVLSVYKELANAVITSLWFGTFLKTEGIVEILDAVKANSSVWDSVVAGCNCPLWIKDMIMFNPKAAALIPETTTVDEVEVVDENGNTVKAANPSSVAKVKESVSKALDMVVKSYTDKIANDPKAQASIDALAKFIDEVGVDEFAKNYGEQLLANINADDANVVEGEIINDKPKTAKAKKQDNSILDEPLEGVQKKVEKNAERAVKQKGSKNKISFPNLINGISFVEPGEEETEEK